MQALTDPHTDGIRFHYVERNHDIPAGLAELDAFTTETDTDHHLSTTPVTVTTGESDVTLYGVDHTDESLDDIAPETTVSSYFGTNILVLHETPHPVVDDDGLPIYSDGVDVHRVGVGVEFNLEKSR